MVPAEAVSTLINNSLTLYVIDVDPSAGLSGILRTTISTPEAAGVKPAQNVRYNGLFCLIAIEPAPLAISTPDPAVRVAFDSVLPVELPISN